MPVDAHGREPGSPHYGEPAQHSTTEVDEDGNPETPAHQAAEKQKQAQRVKVGLALAAIGIVVAVMLAKRSSSQNAGAPTSGMPPTPPGSADLAGSGVDLSSLQNELGGLQTQLGAQQATNAQLLAQEKANANAIAALKNWIAHHQPAQQGGGHTPAEINAGAYPKNVPQAKGGMTIVGHIIAGHKYQGKNSRSGAPVYALVSTGFGPVWEQNFNMSQLPPGTPIATPSPLAHLFS